MAVEISNLCQTMAQIKSAGAGFTSTVAGCVITRTGAGDYNMTLDAPLAAAQACYTPCITGVAASVAAFAEAITVVDTSDTVKRITTSVGGALADLNFSIMAWKFPGA